MPTLKQDNVRPRKERQKTRGRPFAVGNPGRPKGTPNVITLATRVRIDTA